MRISDWSSDVCSSDLRERISVAEEDARGLDDGELVVAALGRGPRYAPKSATILERLGSAEHPSSNSLIAIHAAGLPGDRQRIGAGKDETDTGDLGGSRNIKKKHKRKYMITTTK